MVAVNMLPPPLHHPRRTNHHHHTEMLTKNTALLRTEVAKHVAADSIIQGDYWDAEKNKGCWIGCLAHCKDPRINEETYGLPVMLQRIAENIFESLPADEAKSFFAALPDAVDHDGKDLSCVSWQFLAIELRALPPQRPEIQAVIDPVISGIDLLAQGLEWSRQEAEAAAAAARAARAEAEAEADAAEEAAVWEAALAEEGAALAAEEEAALAAEEAASAAEEAQEAQEAQAAAEAQRRQRDLLLRLISEAPIAAELDPTTTTPHE
jgi:hypothetical protein